MRNSLSSFLFFFSVFFVFTAAVSAQRDYFTADEIELVRDAQEIDRRINVLTHAMDRRFGVLKIDVAAPAFKEKSEWGSLPEGTRSELLRDIRRIMQKAVDDIDSLAERPDSAVVRQADDKKKVEGHAVLFPRAVRSLAQAAARYSPVLRAELDRSTSPAETGSLLETIELCDLVIASVSKLPPDVKKPAKKDR
jgi:hypothetical protein